MYQDMWTSNRHEYKLVTDLPEDWPVSALIIDAHTGAPVVVDDSDEMIEEIIRRMRDAGVAEITFSERRASTQVPSRKKR